MALDKKTLSFALLKGVDEKSSNSARPPDALTVAENADFGKRGELKKRGGFVHDDNMTLTKFGGGTISSGEAIAQYGNETLILDGKNLYSWIKEGTGGDSGEQGLLDRGAYVPCTVKNEFKSVKSGSRQGNCQIAENNGIRVYVWEEYEFQGNKYKAYVDIEHIASGSRLIETTEIASTDISPDVDGAAVVSTIYKQAQPQCAAIGSYIFIVYQVGALMHYRSVNCTKVTAAAAVSSEADLFKSGTSTQIGVFSDYPVFQIDKFLGVTHSDAIIWAGYTSSGNITVRYLTASGATLATLSTTRVISNAYITPYEKGTGGVPDTFFLKCLNDVDSGSEYSIVLGYTANDSGVFKLGLAQFKDDLSATVSHALQQTLADGTSTGVLKLLRGTAGSVTDEGAITVFVEVWSPTTDLGTQGKIVPEHFIRSYTLTRGSTTISTANNAIAFNTSITSDLFRYSGALYCVVSQVNDNALYIDFEASTVGANRGGNNNSVLINSDGVLIGALRTGQAALCLTSDYITNNPDTFDAGRENRRLLFGAQRVTSRDSSTEFVFGASRHVNYAFHKAGTFSSGDFPDNIFGISLFTVDFDPARTLSFVDIENSWLGSGGFIHSYDGNEVVENNFVNYPAIKKVLEATRSTSTHGYSDGRIIKYRAVYVWTDAKGNQHYSMPSEMVEHTVVSGKVSGITTDVSGGVGGGYSAGLKATTTTSGSGSGLTVTIGVTTGAITSVAVTDPGSGYAAGDTVTVDTGSSLATLTVACSGKSIIQVQMYAPSLTRKYDTTLKLYRTAHQGETFYFVADVPVTTAMLQKSSVVTYNDLPVDESAIDTRPQIYTTLFPATGFSGCSTDLIRHQNKLISAGTDDTVYISDVIKEGIAPGFPIGSSFQISLPGDPGHVTAIESNLDNLLVFTNNDGYYVGGSGPDVLGQGRFAEPRLFASGQGALDGAAHTDSPLGVFYQSERGIHLIGRDLSIAYIGAPVEDTVGEKTAVTMTRRDSDNVVRIMLQSASPGSSGNDIYCVYNYYYKQWATYNIAYQSSAHQVGEVYDGTNFQRLTADGRQFTQSTSVYQDRNSAGSALVDYGMTVTTGFISPTGLLKKDRIYRVMLLGEYLAAHTLRVDVYNDYDDATSNQTETKTISSAPAGAYLYRAHLSKQKSRAVKLSVLIGGTTQAITLAGFALEVGMRPDKTSFKTIEDRTL
mgnify:FL=1